MTSRERTLKALRHETPDRVPVDYWGSPEATARLLAHFRLNSKDELLDLLGVDWRWIEGPRYIGPELRRHPDGTTEDIWGVRRAQVRTEEGERGATYSEVAFSPLGNASSVREIESYSHWPSADWFDFSVVAEQCRRYRGKYAVAVAGDRLNRTSLLKAAMYLRGVEQIMMDLVANPALAEVLFERIAAFYLEYNERLFSAAQGGLDIFMTGDDFGTQRALLVSVPMWRRFFAPHLRRFFEQAKRFGLKVMHHSCGAIRPLIPELISLGLDILNPIQPGAEGMDPASLKREFGRELVFHGSIDIQRTLPFGRPEDIREEVKARVEALGPGGGFILCTAHNIQADTPLQNMLALFEAYRELAWYR